MIQVIRQAKMKSMPWKNGRGLTTEIAIAPESADFSQNNFLWRLSCAEIREPNVFSNFIGFDRLLIVWKGAGLTLNLTQRLAPLEPFRFAGEESIHATPVDGVVYDLGVIYRRDNVSAEIKVLHVSESDGAQSVSLTNGFLFCARGPMQIGEVLLREGDALQIQNEKWLKMSSTANAVGLWIELIEKT